MSIQNLVNYRIQSGNFYCTFTAPPNLTRTEIVTYIPGNVTLDDPDWDVMVTSAKDGVINFRNLPEWSTWTPDQAKAEIQSRVLTGQTKAQVDAWIDANVTNIATARTALKLIGGAIIDLREIVAVIGYAILLLRDVVIRRTG